MMPDENISINISAAKNVPNMAPTMRAWSFGCVIVVCRNAKPLANIQNIPPQSEVVSTTTSATRNRDSAKRLPQKGCSESGTASGRRPLPRPRA